MKITVYSIDETTLSPIPDEFLDVIPMHRAPEIETCVIMWEGYLDTSPLEGDTLTIQPIGKKETQSLTVILRVFHLEFEEPILALFVSDDENPELD